jgi:ribosomal protein S18 acetylase RimI-like enzyme
MGHGTAFRRFRREDLDDVKALVDRTIDHCYDPAYSPQAREFFKQYHSRESILDDAQRGVTLVATAGGAVVGTGTLVEGSIRRVFVAPELQGRGLGDELMRRLEEQAAWGREAVELDASTVSLQFYLRRGYRAVREASIEVAGGKALDYHVMRKPLRSPQARGEEPVEQRPRGGDPQ